MNLNSYHAGELKMQRDTCEEIPAFRNSKMISPQIAGGAVRYIEQQSYVIVSSQDRQGNLWISILSGEEGFAKVTDEQTLRLDRTLIQSNSEDVFWKNIEGHPFVGMLFIELSTRRRYRVNGKVRIENDYVFIAVQQAYANCPQYIQRRLVITPPKPIYRNNIVKGKSLTDELMIWIKGSDTFFVGSSDGKESLDASHRGGNPGFVRVVNSTTLNIPDYQGNSMYNTLGNFLIYPNSGLLFIDFTAHRTLQLTGTASVSWQEMQENKSNGQTDRYWSFTVEAWVMMDNLNDVEWSFTDYSPFNPE